ncbi:MAG TPA: hypothetical protein VFR94_07375 [Nitrososphaeraceae archaeon]|nr:hypothetical protein [Nitrososphaeraceae archaeon]
MSDEKTTTRTTAAIAAPLGITIVLPVCCFVISSEVVTTINLATGVLAPSGASNVSVDDSPGVTRMTRYSTGSGTLKLKEEDDYDNQNPHSIPSSSSTTTATRTVPYLIKNYDEDNNIGLVGWGISILNRSRRHHRTSNSGFGNKNNNNNNFDLDGKQANNITDRRSSGSGSNKLIHSSFRIEQEVIKSLERVAASRDMSLSSVVNKILKNYVNSEMYFEELGFILVSKNFLRKTFEGLEQRHIEELGKEYGMTIAKEYISYFYPQVNADTLIQFLEIWFKRFQSWQHRIDENNNNYTLHHYFTVNHDINMNFSLALQSILAGLIEPIIKSTVEFTNVTPSTITFSFTVFRE